LQKTAQATAALGFVGATVVIDGSTSRLANNQAVWNFSVEKPASGTISITSANGQLAYSGTYTINPGNQQFVWDGRGNDGSLWPSGDYTISVTAKDANGQTVAVSTEVEATVDSVDLTQNPPLLSIAGQNVSLDKIKRVVRHAS